MSALSKRDYLTREGVLAVLGGTDDDADLFIAVTDDGAVAAFCGHVDLGTGIKTALTQIVAEELDVSPDRVAMVLGTTGEAPDQGATIASATIQVTAIPLRRAAAQARRFLLGLAAERLGAPAETLVVDDGIVRTAPNGRDGVRYGELLAGRRDRLTLAADTPVKDAASYRVVGQPMARVDIPAKATGGLVHVHDMRVPGMLHGRVVRPPYAGLDSGPFVGNSLIAVDEASIAAVPGIVAVVVIRDFVGIVAEREEQAAKAARLLKVAWRPLPDLPDPGDTEAALRANPSTPRVVHDKGDVEAALAGAATRLRRTYLWPYQMHGSIGPSCALADYRQDGLTVWSGTQNPHVLRADLARLLALPVAGIQVIRMEASGCYGRNCADDVAGDAALLSRAVGRPVRVQLTREQEHAWEPKGAAQVMDVDGGLDAEGGVAGYDFATRYPSNGAPLLALLLTGVVEPVAAVFDMGDRTSIPPYDFQHMRVTIHDMAPIVRASWLRGVSALPNTFAHESYIDELAIEAGVDPIAYRLRYLRDPRAVDLVNAVAAQAGWVPRTGPGTEPQEGDILRGRGFAYALYVHSKFPGYGAAWSAWVADVAVNRTTGDVSVTRVVVGQDSGLMINPDGVRHQVEGNVIQSTSRVLKEAVGFEHSLVASREWGAYPIITFPELPAIDVMLMPRPTEPPLGAGESASVPSAAAIANAIFDATGVRFRELPFTPERIKAGLDAAGKGGAGDAAKPPARRRRLVDYLAAASAGALGIAVAALPWRAAIAPVAPPDPGLYSAATLARGKLLAAMGDCAVCHTAPDGQTNAGGRALETPFGIVYSTNITPDPETGIGTWSYAAFERAMREGIHRDGRHLYPAFPYTAFTKTSDADLAALYAYLMAAPAIRHAPPRTRLAFPFNLRPLMAGWNALFLKTGAYRPDPARSEVWNRGAYIAEGLGHCGACHSPRNLLGAEKTGAAYLAGGTVDGWDAPALTALSQAPIPWSEDEFYAYLSTGQSRYHGVAAGPMAPVVAELAHLPQADIRALAVYLASFNDRAFSPAEEAARAAEIEGRGAIGPADSGARLYQGACAACHQPGTGPVLFGARPSLALNSNLHGARPDNLIRIILDGIAAPAHADLGPMPGFRDSFSDSQTAALVTYLRSQFAPGSPPWQDVEATVARLRRSSGGL